jgi:hypothetical protein
MSRAGRIATVACMFGLSVLAACGGGGGSSTPPVPSTNPAPSGNPSGSPSPSPTGSSSPTATPTATPTAAPTLTPTPSPTQTPTPSPGPSATPNSTLTVNVGAGQINGTDGQILSSAPNTHNNTGEGNLEPGDPGALPQGGGQGPAIDNIPTATTMPNNYHVHAFLGLYVNGQEIAIPDGVGMVNPFGDFNSDNPCTQGLNNFECYADLFYYMHTHDASGVIHMEAPSPTCGVASGFATPCNMSQFTLGNFLDIWGISSSPMNFGPFAGPVTVYTSPLQYAPCPSSGNCYTGSNLYSLYTGDPRNIPLFSHTVVWILVGSGNPAGSSLPNIQWFVEP